MLTIILKIRLIIDYTETSLTCRIKNFFKSNCPLCWQSCGGKNHSHILMQRMQICTISIENNLVIYIKITNAHRNLSNRYDLHIMAKLHKPRTKGTLGCIFKWKEQSMLTFVLKGEGWGKLHKFDYIFHIYLWKDTKETHSISCH